MRCSPKLARLPLSAFVLSLGLAASATAQQILEVNSSSLTTFLPSSATATAIQGIRPHVLQRGVNLDGSLKSPPPLAMHLAGNPFERAWVGKERQGDLRIDLGAYSPMDVDIALPAKGFVWTIGRTYNSRQVDSGGSALTSNGYQGRNWQQVSQPEILLYTGASHSDDVLYLIFRADAYIEFLSANASGTRFKATNGAAGIVEKSAGSPDTYAYHDQNGTTFTFVGFNTGSHAQDGNLWKIEDEDGNTAFVGDSSSVSTALGSNVGWDSAGRITTAYDSESRRFTYSYSTLDSVVRLTEVKAETKTGATWASPGTVTEVAKVNYAYYGDETFGDKGDLKKVTITTPLTDSGVSQVKKKYYRYWEGSSDNTAAYDVSTNPGYPHEIMLVLGFEGARRFDWDQDGNLDEDYTAGGVTTASLKSYAADFFEYDSSRRVRKAFANGACGCSGGSSGIHEYTYDAITYTNNAGYDEAVASRTVVKRPDNSYLTQCFDEVGQGLGQIVTDVDPSGGSPKFWATWPERDSNTGCVTYLHMPDNLDSFTYSTGVCTGLPGDGVIYVLGRTSSGDGTGFMTTRRVKEGTSTADADAIYLDKTVWDFSTISKTWTDAAATVVRPLVSATRAYPTAGNADSGYNETTYAYTVYSSALVYETVTKTNPIVSTGNNGSNGTTTSSVHYRKDGRADFEKNEDARIDYHAYTAGQETQRIEDADTGSLSPPSGFSHTGTPLKRQTSTAYATQGPVDSQVLYELDSLTVGPQTYRSKLADERMIVLHLTDKVTSIPPTYYGPVRFEVVNHAGKTEVSGVIALSGNDTTDAMTAFIDETKSDPLEAIHVGTVAQMRVAKLDDSGTQVDEERAYFSVPGSGAGTEGTHYDATRYGYDGSGRRWRVKEATGTIRRTVFDLLGRATESWMGTNDHTFSGGESVNADNMVKTEAREYDGTYDKGNSLLTKATRYVEGSTTDQRITEYLYDWRGRQVVTLNPNAPHTLQLFDNMNRVVATGQYSSTSGLDATDDPTGLATNRMALSETLYDELGRPWKTIRHEIDDADGSDDDTLESLTWYDAEGRVIKVRGEEYKKTAYDRLGRVTDEFVLAKDNDSGYGDADDVSGDIVLEQYETRYSGTKPDVLMSVTIQRKHNDISGGETTGELDTNADALPLKVTAANLKGRAQMTAHWYDTWGRRTDTVVYGTNGGSDFDRSGLSVPSRSDTELRTTTAYNDDGTVDTITDPRAKVMKYVYDALGRRTKEIKNYDSGVNSGDPDGTADNVTVLYGYTNGLRTSLTADMPYPQTDQVTTYIYGTTAGTPSAMTITTGHLLRAVKYPDSTNAGTNQAYIDGTSEADVVSFAYNAQGQETSKKDQAGNILDSTYDTSGRRTKQTASTVASGFDSAVRRVESSFDTLGRASEIVQYDATTSGSATDGVKYAYDDWGNISTYEEDRNGAVASDQYTTSYTWAKNAPTYGRYTLRKSGMVMPGGRTLSYTYRSAGGLHDDEASRVSTIVDSGPGTICQYDYLGVGTVVRTKYNEISCFSRVYDGTPTYADLDRFNRITTSRWTKDPNPAALEDFYQVALTYDRDSNITSAEDNVHTGFDVKYTMDSVNRLTQAEEGTLSGGSITSKTRDQQWTLSHTGNWDREKLNLNGDGDFTDSGEHDDTRTHNSVNELTARDTDSNSSNNYTLSYDAAGNMTDDGENYKYEYDAWNRLRKVKQTGNSALVAEYRYNGLSHRIGVHEDTDTDNDVDSNDKWFYDAFDEGWRMLARFRESDTSPKEDFVLHQAGASGRGGSSYIDLVVDRNRDESSFWTSSSDGVLEARLYYCQNWRADVSALVTYGSVLKEWVKYSAYGTPIGLPAGDTDSDGDCDGTDVSQVHSWWYPTPAAYDVRGDPNLDGVVDTSDETIVSGLSGTTLGRGVMSATAIASRRGHAGLEASSGLAGGKWLARNRMFAADLGRWNRRDPIEYPKEPSLYAAFVGNPVSYGDPLGLVVIPCGTHQSYSMHFSINRRVSSASECRTLCEVKAKTELADFQCPTCLSNAPLGCEARGRYSNVEVDVDLQPITQLSSGIITSSLVCHECTVDITLVCSRCRTTAFPTLAETDPSVHNE